MDYVSTVKDDHLKDAAYLLQLVGRPAFTTSSAIYAVSLDELKSRSSEAIQTVKVILFTIGFSTYLGTNERCYAIMKLVKKLPNLTPKKKNGGGNIDLSGVSFKDFRETKLTDIIRLIDLPSHFLLSGQKYYRGIYRHIEAQEKQEQRQQLETTTNYEKLAPVSSVSPRLSFADSISMLSTSLQSQQFGFASPSSAAASPSQLSLPSEQQHLTSNEFSSAALPSSSSSSIMSDFLKVSSLPEIRRTLVQKQDERARKLAYRDTYSSAYKIGSQMLKHQLDSRLPLERFDGNTLNEKALKVACRVNEMYGIDLLGGGEIKKCVQEHRVGESPKRKGVKTRLPADEEAAIRSLVYTASSLEQINCDPNTRDRPMLRKDIMEIVNAKLEKDGKQPLNETKYYERIEESLARDITLSVTNKRDALRTAWCCYGNQELDYKVFEETVVDRGFGRWTQTEEERREHGNIMLFPGQVSISY